MFYSKAFSGPEKVHHVIGAFCRFCKWEWDREEITGEQLMSLTKGKVLSEWRGLVLISKSIEKAIKWRGWGHAMKHRESDNQNNLPSNPSQRSALLSTARKQWTEKVAKKGLSRQVSRGAWKRRINRELKAKMAHKLWIREGPNSEVQRVN